MTVHLQYPSYMYILQNFYFCLESFCVYLLRQVRDRFNSTSVSLTLSQLSVYYMYNKPIMCFQYVRHMDIISCHFE